MGSQEDRPKGLFFKTDGTKMYVIGESSDSVYQYTLSTPWNLATASYDSDSLSVSDSSPGSTFFNPDGTKMFYLGVATKTVYQYSL